MKNTCSKIIVLLSIISILVFLIIWKQIPDEIAIHWNVVGHADRYGNKIFYLLFTFIPITIILGSNFLMKIASKKKKYPLQGNVYWFFINLWAFAFLLLNWVFFLIAMGFGVNVAVACPILIGILMICVGNYLPLVKENYFLGIRTPWTLADKNVWKKTHRISGIVFVFMGILMIFGIWIPQEFKIIFLFLSVLGGTLFCYAYSYYCYKKLVLNKK